MLVRNPSPLLQDPGSGGSSPQRDPSGEPRHRADREPGRRGIPVRASNGRDSVRGRPKRGHPSVPPGMTKKRFFR